MKVLERLVLAHLQPQVKSSLDPLQVAYQPRVGVDDAIVYLLERAQSHLDGTGGSERITFFNCSSAFNTIQLLPGGGGQRVHRFLDHQLPHWQTTICQTGLCADWDGGQ